MSIKTIGELVEGDEFANTLEGGIGDDTIFGFGGDDILVDGDGNDSFFGGDGTDTLVLDGEMDDFFSINVGNSVRSIEGEFLAAPVEFNEDFVNTIGIIDDNSFEFLTVGEDIEFLQFDDETVSLLEFIDDFGDTRETAGFIQLKPAVSQKSEIGEEERAVGYEYGSIDTTDDVDSFEVSLDAGITYQINVESFSNYYPYMFGPSLSSFGSSGVDILSVFDENDNLIEGLTDDGNGTVSFTAATDGDFIFSVAGTDGFVGEYEITVDELRTVGDEFDNDLLGTSGDDILEGNGGYDFIDGNDGVDVAVFSGNREDFFIESDGFGKKGFGSFDEDTQSIFVSNSFGIPFIAFPKEVEILSGSEFDILEEIGAEQAVEVLLQSAELINVETLRFDDGDVSVLEFIDDFNDTLGTSGEFVDVGEFKDNTYKGDFSAKAYGRIDLIGDVDTFTVDLEAGDTFLLELYSENNFFFGPASPEEGGASTAPFTIQSILDPEGTEVESVSAESFYDEDTVLEFFRANQSGTYLISFAGLDENIGNYVAYLNEFSFIGDDEMNYIDTTTLDDVVDAQGGDDVINSFFTGGTDFIDGGEGEDTFVGYSFDLAASKFAVSEDGEVVLTDPDGNVTTLVNVENFEFVGDMFSNEDEQVFTLEELQEFAELAGDDEDFTLQLGDDDDNELVGGTGNDIYQGGAGNDLITDAGGDNNVDAGEGADVVALVSGSNTVDGGADGDLIIGGFGNDDLAGGEGNDVIIGDVSTNLFGSDRIEGGAGDDLLEGRGGQDTFVFATNDGTDTIGTLDVDYDDLANTSVTGADFVSGLDLIELNGFAYADQNAAFANVSDVDGVATFNDQGTTIIFDGLTTADLSSDDFILV